MVGYSIFADVNNLDLITLLRLRYFSSILTSVNGYLQYEKYLKTKLSVADFLLHVRGSFIVHNI